MEIYRYYTAMEVVDFTGVSYRRLDYWIREGIVRCSGRKSVGRGSPRLFTFADLIEIRVVKSLTEHGMRLKALRECIKQLRKKVSQNNDWPLASVRLITDGKSIFRYLADDNVLESMDEFGQFAFSFGIGNEIQKISSKILNTKRPVRYTKNDKDTLNINCKEATK